MELTFPSLKDLTLAFQNAEGFPPVVAALQSGRAATVDGAWNSSAALAAAALGLNAPHTLLIVIAAVYAVIEGVEAVGLWRERRWAEYLTCLATVGFIPYEVYELTRSTTAFKVGALVLNVAVLVYLVWSKRLFGAGRIHPPRRDEHDDPLLLLANPLETTREGEVGRTGH